MRPSACPTSRARSRPPRRAAISPYDTVAPADATGGLVFGLVCVTAAVLLALVLRPIAPRVEVSEAGLTLKAILQRDRFIWWHDLLGLVWIDARAKSGRLYTLVLEVWQDGMVRRRVKVGSAAEPGTITELRDEIIRRRKLVEVTDEPNSAWDRLVSKMSFLTTRRVWRHL